jgi:hypothetical protein
MIRRAAFAGAPALCALLLAACGGGSEADPPSQVETPPTVTLSSNVSSVTSGGSVTLTWSSTDATSCTASGGWSGAQATSGSAPLGPLTANTTATLSCTGAGGTAQQSVTVTVTAATPAPAVTLTANPTSVMSGGSSQLTWTSTNATTCTASGAWSGGKATSGTQSTGALSAQSAYTLSCTGAGGTSQQSVTISITATPPAPTVTLTANPVTVASGGSSQLTWSSTNATSCTASGAWSGAKTTSGTQSTGALTALSIYSLSCTGAGGNAQASATVDVTPPAGSSAVSGRVDSSFPDIQGDNRVYVFAGNVTPDDDDGDGGDPLQKVSVTQDSNACTFSYSISGLAPGTYTLAFTRQAANDRVDLADTISFTGTTSVTVAASPLTQNFTPASILRVGPGRTYTTIAAAANAASAGAVIEVDAGTYPDDVVVWRENRVTVRGIGGRAHVQGTRRIPFQSGSDRNNGMGLWVVRGTDIRVENIEFSNAMVDDQNGAGIRNQGSNLTICNSVFRDNENGILGGAYGQLTIEYSTFMRNGSGDVGRTHNLYIDEGSSAGDRLVFRHNYSHHASIGHLLKTRARENWILYNRIMDENDGTSSYAIDAPNGGLTYIIGNLIQQGPNTDNAIVIAYGAEGLGSGRTNALYVVNNTIVNDRGSGTFFDVAGGTTTFRSVNNLFTGGGTLYSGTQPTASNNVNSSSAGLVDRAGFDYRLTAGSPAVNAGTDPGLAGAFSLMPVFQYQNPAQRDARATVGTIDVGAYEYAP